MLDFRTYSAANQGEDDKTTAVQLHLWKHYDRNNIPADERMAICYVRGVALALVNWIRRSCILKNPKGEVIKDLPGQHLVHVLDALYRYKTHADYMKLLSAPHCTISKLNTQVTNVATCDPAVKKLFDETFVPKPKHSSVHLRITLDEGCTVQWRDEAPLSLKKLSECFFLPKFCQTHFY